LLTSSLNPTARSTITAQPSTCFTSVICGIQNHHSIAYVQRCLLMSSKPVRADSLLYDIDSSMRQATAAAGAGSLYVAHHILTFLHERLTAHQQLPAHHQRRRMMEDLGFCKLGHIDVPFSSLVTSPSGLVFVDDDLEPIPDHTLYARLCRRSPGDFYEHTRLTSTEFLILYQELHPAIIRPRDSDLATPVDPTHIARFSHRRLHPIDELLLWLYYVDGNRDTVLSLLFDIDRTSVFVITDHITRVMNHVWVEEVRWPSRDERKELYGFFSCHEKAIGCIDGTHCRIDVPASDEKEDSAYSGYKHYHTQNYLLCCDAFGFILHVNGPFNGSWNDKQCFAASDFMDPALHMLDDDEKLITDGGFTGFPMNIHPFSAPQLDDAKPEDRPRMVSWNEELTLNRSLNEHVNHHLKARAQALAGKWSKSVVRQRDVFMVAARFHNRVRRLRVEYRLYCLQLTTEMMPEIT
jgi:hypothetical protein